jgi:hypothetical protein
MHDKLILLQNYCVHLMTYFKDSLNISEAFVICIAYILLVCWFYTEMEISRVNIVTYVHSHTLSWEFCLFVFEKHMRDYVLLLSQVYLLNLHKSWVYYDKILGISHCYFLYRLHHVLNVFYYDFSQQNRLL